MVVAMDYTTGWPATRAIPEATTEEVIKLLYEEVAVCFGCPKEIYSNRGINLSDP